MITLSEAYQLALEFSKALFRSPQAAVTLDGLGALDRIAKKVQAALSDPESQKDLALVKAAAYQDIPALSAAPAAPAPIQIELPLSVGGRPHGTDRGTI